MEKNQNGKRYALVTGGSSGIGMELSKLLIKDGYSVIIVAKPQEELERAKAWFDKNMPNAELIYFQQDLAIQGAAQKVYDFTSQNGYDIEILMNNAGFGSYGWDHEFEIDRNLGMLNLLVITVYHMTRLYLKDMMAKDRGRILITSSQGGLIPTPKSSAYSAGKAFSYFYGVALNEELKDLGSNVNVTVLLPPPTRTGFQHAAKMDHLRTFDKGSRFVKEPDQVALEGYEGLKKKKMFVLAGKADRIMLKMINPFARERVIRRLMNFTKLGTKEKKKI
ncbi:MAG: SDR family NAD(P)-dependent oxidoreductase [Promethearchaeota archaeon]